MINTMKFRLRLSGLDEDDEERLFESEAEAIEYARKWFLDGYDNDTINDDGRESAKKYAAQIEPDLRSGREFYCPMFYEKIRLDTVN